MHCSNQHRAQGQSNPRNQEQQQGVSRQGEGSARDSRAPEAAETSPPAAALVTLGPAGHSLLLHEDRKAEARLKMDCPRPGESKEE